MEVSSSKREKEMLLLLFYRGYTPSVGSSVVNHSKMYFLQSVCLCWRERDCVSDCDSVHVPLCVRVWWKDDYPPGTFSLNALFFNIVLENYRWKWLIKKSTYFYWDEESHDPICAFVSLFSWSSHVSAASVSCFFSLPLFQVPKCLLFFRDSLWSVNMESQIAINNLYTPSFYVVKTWCMLQMMLRYLGWYVLFMVSHFYFFGCLGCVLFGVFWEIYFSLGPYWMEVSTWWY